MHTKTCPKMHKQMCPQKCKKVAYQTPKVSNCFKTCIPKPVQICPTCIPKPVQKCIIKCTYKSVKKVAYQTPKVSSCCKTCIPKPIQIYPTCIPKPSQNFFQHASKTMHLPNIHDHLHKQHFNICKSNLHDSNLSKPMQICLNMSINYFPQTKSPTPVTNKLSKKQTITKPVTYQSLHSKKQKHVKKKNQCFHFGLFFFSALTP
jgi:hypothetical protein